MFSFFNKGSLTTFLIQWLSHGQLLRSYIANTFILITGVSILSTAIGVINAWFMVFFSFPGKKILRIAMLLPLALPAYITAFTYGHSLEFAGPVQSFLRTVLTLHHSEYWFPNIKSLWGAILILSLALYPYIYLVSYASFSSLSSIVSIAKTLGKSGYTIMYRVILPLTFSSIMTGVALVAMEVISDFGTAKLFNVNTFAIAIYRSWFLLNDYTQAACLACMILLFVFTLITFTHLLQKTHTTVNSYSTVTYDWPLYKGITIFCALFPILGFAIPVLTLIYWASVQLYNDLQTSVFFETSVYVWNSVKISLISASFSVITSVLLAYKRKCANGLTKVATMGYAIPRTIIAISALILFGTITQFTHNVYPHLNIVLIGTISALVYTYVFSFLASTMYTIETSLQTICREITWTARLLGKSNWYTYLNIRLPLIKKSLLIAFLFVFLDSIKELAITVILRPFNFETMATKMFVFIEDERYYAAAIPALAIALIGTCAVIVLTKLLYNKNYDYK